MLFPPGGMQYVGPLLGGANKQQPNALHQSTSPSEIQNSAGKLSFIYQKPPTHSNSIIGCNVKTPACCTFINLEVQLVLPILLLMGPTEKFTLIGSSCSNKWQKRHPNVFDKYVKSNSICMVVLFFPCFRPGQVRAAAHCGSHSEALD